MSLQGQVAVVTGGSRGIGRAICVRLAEEGADVVINYAGNEAAAKETEALCREKGVRTLVVQADVSDPKAVDALFQAAIDFGGRIDILVNNAGIAKDALLMQTKQEDFDRVIEVNLRSCFACMKKASRIMIKQRYGRIISMSSVVGLYGNAGQVSYAAAKAGIIGMTKSLAKEVASRNVTVNAIAPGMIDTEMTKSLNEGLRTAMIERIPAGKPGQPEDIANLAAFLADPRTGYITGQVINVDGGMF